MLLFIRKDSSGWAYSVLWRALEKEVTCHVWNNETFFFLIIILTTVLPKNVRWDVVSGVVCHLLPGGLFHTDVFCQENELFIWLLKKSFGNFFFATPQSTRNFVWEFGNHSFKIPYRDAMPVDITHLFQQGGGQIIPDIYVTKSQISFFKLTTTIPPNKLQLHRCYELCWSCTLNFWQNDYYRMRFYIVQYNLTNIDTLEGSLS